MTDADLNQAIRIAGIQHTQATTVAMSNAALDHLEMLREAQRRRAQCGGEDAIRLEQALSVPLHAQIETLKDTIDCQDKDLSQLNEAREAAARADAKVEEIYAELQVAKAKADKHRKKVLQQGQTIQALENALSRQQDESARLRGELNGANSANAKLRGTRDEIRRKLLERMRKDLLNAWPQDNYLLVSDFKEAIDRYLQEIEEGIDP